MNALAIIIILGLIAIWAVAVVARAWIDAAREVRDIKAMIAGTKEETERLRLLHNCMKVWASPDSNRVFVHDPVVETAQTAKLDISQELLRRTTDANGDTHAAFEQAAKEQAPLPDWLWLKFLHELLQYDRAQR